MASALRVAVAAAAGIGCAATSLVVGAAALAGVVPGTGGTVAAYDAALTPTPAADVAVAWALARVGTPYRWGGVGQDGFDCSGLVQAAYAAAGVQLPRVAQDQYDAGPRLGAGPVRRGDLVFFGTSPTAVDHVGIALGDGDMVDAPHTGATVRVEPVWSSGYLGATRPAG